MILIKWQYNAICWWLDFAPCPLNHSKYFLKILPITVYLLAKFQEQMMHDSKHLKMYSTLCANTHSGFATLEVGGMIWNQKKMCTLRTDHDFFMKLKKILNWDYIFRSYNLFSGNILERCGCFTPSQSLRKFYPT